MIHRRGWQHMVAVLLPPKVLIAAAIRGSIAGLGFWTLPWWQTIDPYLGKVVFGVSLIFSMMATYGLIMPIESVVTMGVAGWMQDRALRKWREMRKPDDDTEFYACFEYSGDGDEMG